MKSFSNFPTFTILLYIIIALLILLVMPAFGQADRIAEARRLSYDGQYEAANTLFNEVLADDPANIDARLGSAYNHSWHKSLDQAETAFRAILESEPRLKPALIGLGYTLAWKGDYANAKYPFLNGLQYYPHDPEIEKGLAYVYLWQGSPEVAIDMFTELQKKDPAVIEYYTALAYAHIQRYETIAARRSIRQAISLDSTNEAALAIRRTLDAAPPFLELDVWGGASTINGSTRAGLRNVQVSVQVSKRFRALASFDNNMSLDNYYFLNEGLFAETFLAGGVQVWDEINQSRLQTGARIFETGPRQWLMLGEHAFSLSDRKIIKVGGMYATGDDLSDEWMLYAGMNLPLSSTGIRIEPMYYVNQNFYASRLEHRMALSLQWRAISGIELQAGGHYGKVDAGENTMKSTYGWYSSALFPVIRLLWLEAYYRQEHGIPGTLKMLGLGAKLRFEK